MPDRNRWWQLQGKRRLDRQAPDAKDNIPAELSQPEHNRPLCSERVERRHCGSYVRTCTRRTEALRRLPGRSDLEAMQNGRLCCKSMTF